MPGLYASDAAIARVLVVARSPYDSTILKGYARSAQSHNDCESCAQLDATRHVIQTSVWQTLGKAYKADPLHASSGGPFVN